MIKPLVNSTTMSEMLRLPASEIAANCGVDLPIAQRWKRGVSRIPKAARDIIGTLREKPEKVPRGLVSRRLPARIKPLVEPEGRPLTAAYGIRSDEVARRCGVDIATARRWKSGVSRIPATASAILARDLAAFDPAWRGWTVRAGKIISPEGWAYSPGEVLSLTFLRSQVANLEALRRANNALVEQPRPGSIAPDIRAVAS